MEGGDLYSQVPNVHYIFSSGIILIRKIFLTVATVIFKELVDS